MRPRETDGGGESREVRRERARRLEESERAAAGRGSGGEVDEGARESEFQRVTDSARQRLKTAEDTSAKQALRDSIEAAFRTAVEERKRRRPAVETTEPRTERRESDEERVTREARAELGARRMSVEDEERRFSLVKAAFTEAVEEMNRARARESKSRTTDTQVAIRPAVREESAVSKEEEKVEQRKEDTFKAPFRERLTREELDAAIRQHVHLEKVLSEERYKEAVEFCEKVRQQNDGAVCGEVPRLISHIERQEARRIEHERNITEEVLIHRTDPEAARRVLTDVRDLKRPEIVEMADAVERLYRTNPDHERVRVHYSELYQQGIRLADDRFRDFAEAIRENRAAVEKALNERLGLGEGSKREVRIAVVDSRLYTWTKDTSIDRWEVGLDNQKMYWRTKADMVEVLDQVAKHLHIRGGPDVVDRYTNELINQLSRLEDAAWNRTRRYYIRQYTDGEAMHLIVDTLGLSIGDIKSRVKSMGISARGRIKDPQFPEIHEWRMKSVAIIESDGSLQPTRQLRFHEDARDRDRCMIVYQHFCEFGHFKFKEHKQPDGNDTCIALELPMVIGALMKKWGVPPGDKAIYNRGLHDCIVTEPLEVKKHYLPEVIAQDGCFTRGSYQITRDHVIDAGCKKKAYQKLLNHVPELSSPEIELVKTYGRPIPASLEYGPGDRIGLRMSTIQRLTESEDHLLSETAKKLQQAATSIPNRLLDDEVHKIIEPFGIDMSIGPREVVFFKGTGRVSVVSEARTKTKDDAIRWSLIAPPNHPRKMRLVAEFVRKHPEDVRRIKAQIEKEGLKMHPIWEDYRIE